MQVGISLSSDLVLNGNYVYVVKNNNVSVNITTDVNTTTAWFDHIDVDIILTQGSNSFLVKELQPTTSQFSTTITVPEGTWTVKVMASECYKTTSYPIPANDGQATASLSVINYTTPTITQWSGYRCTSAGVESPTGTYVKVKASVTAPNSTPTITMKSKVKGASSYSKTQTLTNNAETIISGYDTSSSYVFDLFVTDNYGASLSRSFEIGTQPVLVDFKAGGTGMAIGKVAETDNLLEVALPSKFNGNVQVLGALDATAANSAKLGGSLPSAFAPAPTVLYNNTSGSNSTITLSQSAANFTHMRIYYNRDNSLYQSVDVYSPDGKTVALSTWQGDSSNIYFATAFVSINTTSIIWGAGKHIFGYIPNGGTNNIETSATPLKIVRVEAWN